jgi:hypothetical protein
MATLEQYLSNNPTLSTADDTLDQPKTEISLNVILTAISPARIEFTARGQRYTIKRTDVLDISDSEIRETESSVGKSVILKVKADTLLASLKEVPATRLNDTAPFAFRRSPAPFPAAGSIAEERWRSRVGYKHIDGTTGLTFTPSGGGYDDSGFDGFSAMMR